MLNEIDEEVMKMVFECKKKMKKWYLSVISCIFFLECTQI